MIVTTIPSIEGRTIRQHHGIVTGEVILGGNTYRNIGTQVRDTISVRWKAYLPTPECAGATGLCEMGEHAA